MRRMMPPMLRSSTPAAYVVAWMFPCPPWLLLGGLSPLEASGPRNLRAVPESGRYLRGARAWPAIENTGSPSHVNPVNGLVSDRSEERRVGKEGRCSGEEDEERSSRA